jgi:hypothetical protein
MREAVEERAGESFRAEERSPFIKRQVAQPPQDCQPSASSKIVPIKTSGHYPKQNPRSKRVRSDVDAKSALRMATGLPHHDDVVLHARRGGRPVRRQLTTVKPYSCAESGLGRSFEPRVLADPVQILGGGIDLVRETTMREFDEFGNEFATPSGISRQHNLPSQDRIDVSAKPRGLRALGRHLVNESVMPALHHRNQRRPVGRPLNENRPFDAIEC